MKRNLNFKKVLKEIFLKILMIHRISHILFDYVSSRNNDRRVTLISIHTKNKHELVTIMLQMDNII